MQPPLKKSRPYDDAPRIPSPVTEGEHIALTALVSGNWFEVEIGPGRGGFLLERAEAAKEAALIGLEIRRKWATLVDRRLEKAGYAKRARVFAEDAKFALTKLGPDDSVRVVYLHFPDPWWKKRHQKRLVMGATVLDEIHRLLSPSGELYVQTDVEERAHHYESLLSQDTRFVAAGDEVKSPWMAENPYGARSPREHRAIADGLPIFRLRYRKRIT